MNVGIIIASLTGGGVRTAVGNACHQHHLGFVGSQRQVRVSHGALPGDERSGLVSKVPVEGDVRGTEVLAGVVELHVESDGSVLDEALVVLVDVADLVERDGERDLICRGRKTTLYGI